MALERVALGQHRFRLPGLAADRRGVVLGRLALLALPSFDRLAAFLRLFLAESALDDLQSLKLIEARSDAGVRQYLVHFSASSSELCDKVARIALRCQAQLYSGAERHFVQYRDAHSPVGYDVETLSQQAGDFVLYREAAVQVFHRSMELSFLELALKLELEVDRSQGMETRFLLIRAGLGRSVLGYLERNRIETAAGFLAGHDHLFTETDERLLVQVGELPPRMRALFAGLPGVTRFAAVMDNVLVELGFRHPFVLERCAQAFGSGLYLLSHRSVEIVPQPPALIAGRNLLFEVAVVRTRPAESLAPGERARLSSTQVALRLRPATIFRRPQAALIPWSQLETLRAMVYLCTPAMLNGHLLAAFAEGLVLIAPAGLEMPLGRLLSEAAEGVFVPVGRDLHPRVSGEMLREKVAASSDQYKLFVDDGLVLSCARQEFLPLGRALLARIDSVPASADERVMPMEDEHPAELVNGELGAFPLWGLRRERSA